MTDGSYFNSQLTINATMAAMEKEESAKQVRLSGEREFGADYCFEPLCCVNGTTRYRIKWRLDCSKVVTIDNNIDQVRKNNGNFNYSVSQVRKVVYLSSQNANLIFFSKDD